MLKKKKFVLLIVLMLVFSLISCTCAFGATKTAGPWTPGTPLPVVWWGDNLVTISWTYGYTGTYSDSGTTRTVTDHSSGGCIEDHLFSETVSNFLRYYRNGSFVKELFFDQTISAMCAYPKHPYARKKSNDPISYSITGDTFQTRVYSYWYSSACDPSQLYRDKIFTW